MIEINWTILIQVVNFLILIFFLNVLVFKPIRGILNQRKSKIDKLENTIDSIGRDAEAKNQSFDEGIKAARMRGQSEKDLLLKAAIDEEKAIIARINAQAKEDLEKVKMAISKDIDDVKKALEKEVDGFADAIALKILGRTA